MHVAEILNFPGKFTGRELDSSLLELVEAHWPWKTLGSELVKVHWLWKTLGSHRLSLINLPSAAL